MLCRECDEYSTCTELCEDAEEYVNQDHVGRDELPTNDIDCGETAWPDGERVIYLTELEVKISKLQKKDFSYQDISYLLGIAIQTVYNNICSIRKKYNNS